MKKQLLCIATLLLISNVYAHNLPKVTLVLKEDHVKLPDDIKKKLSNTNSNVFSQQANTSATANAVYAQINKRFTATGTVNYHVLNTTNSVQWYWSDEWMCVNNDTSWCYHVRYDIELDPGASISATDNISTDYQISVPGIYEDEAIVQITGESASLCEGTNKVTISN